MTSRVSDIQAISLSKTSRYRPEIDGLRAFAVVAVIINHFNKDILPGGYLGVDIFFVISGYVITSSLFGRPSKDFKDFISGFYERRIKRLVPALSVFVLITSISICLFNPSPVVSLRTGLTSLFGLSNLYLLKQSTDYFAQSTELNVFTHTWSLGVEEQFYILFPFLIWFSGFGRQTKNSARNLFLIVGVLTIASLIGFLYLYPINQPAAYFLMPSRFWEMAAGCLIFIGFQKRASIEQSLEKVPPLLVLALIVGVMYLPMSMASASTIAVVALSSILIASLKKQTAAFKVFTNPKVVYIGLISYSLYLWHWGVLSISRWTIGIHWWSVPFQIALMFGLAIVSYRWIETPLRKGNWFAKRWKTLVFGAGVLVILSVGLTVLDNPLNGRLFTGKTSNLPRRSSLPCREDVSENTHCYYIDSNAGKTLWVLGDSHAGALQIASEKVAKSANMNLELYTAGGTPFPPIYHYHKWDKQGSIQKLNDYKVIEKRLRKHLSNGDYLLLALRLPWHFGGVYYEKPSERVAYFGKDGGNASQADFFASWIQSVNDLASFARNRNAKLIIHTPTPEWEREVGLGCSYRNAQWFNSLQDRDCMIESKFFTDSKTGIYASLLSSLYRLANSNENIYVLDIYSIVCPGDICKFNYQGDDIYRDDDHLDSRWASKFIAPKINELIKK